MRHHKIRIEHEFDITDVVRSPSPKCGARRDNFECHLPLKGIAQFGSNAVDTRLQSTVGFHCEASRSAQRLLSASVNKLRNGGSIIAAQCPNCSLQGIPYSIPLLEIDYTRSKLTEIGSKGRPCHSKLTLKRLECKLKVCRSVSVDRIQCVEW